MAGRCGNSPNGLFPGRVDGGAVLCGPGAAARCTPAFSPVHMAGRLCLALRAGISERQFCSYKDARPLVQAESFQALEAVPGRYLQQANGLYFLARGDPKSSGHRYWAAMP